MNARTTDTVSAGLSCARIVSSSRARLRIAVAAEADRRLADALDQLESVLALLLPQGIAEYAAEQADVVL